MSTALPPPAVPETASILPPEEWPCVDHLVTEDDTPVDNIYSAKQQDLLKDPLDSSWLGPDGDRLFLVLANVAIYYATRTPPLIPDVFLSLGVKAPDDLWTKRNRSYLIWEYGKAPEVVIEIVSSLLGQEGSRKLQLYAQIGILYYVIWDPLNLLQGGRLRILVLREKVYVPLEAPWLPLVGLGLKIWHGTYKESADDWLRWCDREGQVIPTGAERAEKERQRADEERRRADEERQRANQALQRADRERQRADQKQQHAEKLAAQLRALGVEPEANQTERGS